MLFSDVSLSVMSCAGSVDFLEQLQEEDW